MKQLMTGNEAIARGAWEYGVRYAAAYPGTPSTEILENIANYKEIISEWSPNEKVALETAIGAAFAGGRAMACMKMVGLNVAADPLFTVAYTGINAGLVVVTADDPGMHSSQNEQDNRYYARAARMAMLEPSDSQEAKDFIQEAFHLSEQYDMPVLYRMTTRVCHSKSMVELEDGRREMPIVKYTHKDKFNPVPAISRKLHAKVEKNLEALEEYSNNSPLNRIEWGDKKIGIVTSGISYQYAKEVFGDNASYLKIGLSYPLPMAKIRDFASQVETLYVIEELEPIMETEIRAAGIDCIGKDRIPRQGELNPDIVRKVLLGAENEVITYNEEDVVDRPPTFCAGCPHRGFFQMLSKMKNVVAVSDIGCYALGQPKDIAINMGGGFTVSCGAQKIFNQTGEGLRCVGMMGDSTFFHSGMTGVLEAVYNKANVLLVILDNRTTGMTGHQENPGTGYTLSGEPTNPANIEDICIALGVKHVRTINPLHLEDVKVALDWGMSYDEPVVLITRYPCALKKFSAEDKKEFGVSRKVNVVDQERCIGCRACIRTGCPALEYMNDAHKVKIDVGQCNGCNICAQVCPKQAIFRKDR